MNSMGSYIWPDGGRWHLRDEEGQLNPSTKARVATAVGLMVGAKLLNIQVPFFFK